MSAASYTHVLQEPASQPAAFVAGLAASAGRQAVPNSTRHAPRQGVVGPAIFDLLDREDKYQQSSQHWRLHQDCATAVTAVRPPGTAKRQTALA